MLDNILNIGYGASTDNQLIEALSNAWFQALVLGVLAIGIPVFVGFDIELWNWPVFLAIPITAWWFGRWYGRYNQVDDRSGYL